MIVDPQALIRAALEVQQQAYARYSRFPVGAALATPAGAIIVGCNVENVSYGLTICAERAAVFTAIARGENAFTGLAIASPGGVVPCGACLQVLAEFVDDMPIWLVDSAGGGPPQSRLLRELLPHRFQ